MLDETTSGEHKFKVIRLGVGGLPDKSAELKALEAKHTEIWMTLVDPNIKAAGGR